MTNAAATANVIRMPMATASGRAVVKSPARADARAKTAPMTEAPVMRPRFLDRLSIPEMTPRWSGGDIRHDGGVVGRLEQRVAGGDETIGIT